MHRNRWSAVVLLTSLNAALLLPVGVVAPPAAATPPGTRKVIANLFEWNWTSVASECQNFLGPRGYGYVQVSPPQEHVRGDQWWVAYQPVSYLIKSRKGTRAQFQSMVNSYNNAGVKVIVNAVINHMTGQEVPVRAGPARHTATTTILASTRPRTSTIVDGTGTTTSSTTRTGTRCRTASWSTSPTSTVARSTFALG